MLLMIEKDIRGGKCHSMIDMKKLITNTREIMIKIKKASHLKYWDANNLYE